MKALHRERNMMCGCSAKPGLAGPDPNLHVCDINWCAALSFSGYPMRECLSKKRLGRGITRDCNSNHVLGLHRRLNAHDHVILALRISQVMRLTRNNLGHSEVVLGGLSRLQMRVNPCLRGGDRGNRIVYILFE